MRFMVFLENITGLTLIGRRRRKSTGWQVDWRK